MCGCLSTKEFAYYKEITTNIYDITTGVGYTCISTVYVTYNVYTHIPALERTFSDVSGREKSVSTSALSLMHSDFTK